MERWQQQLGAGRQVLQCHQNREFVCIYIIYEVTSNVLLPLFAPKIDHKSENLSFFVPEIDHTTKNIGEIPPPPPPDLTSEVIFPMEI